MMEGKRKQEEKKAKLDEAKQHFKQNGGGEGIWQKSMS